MSDLGSKHSTKGNITVSINTNQKMKDKQKGTANKNTSIKEKEVPVQLTFEKSEKNDKNGEKIKKNLTKEFQTFNNHNQDPTKSTKKHESNLKITRQQKSNAQRQRFELTTQSKSPLVNSNMASKARLSQYKEKSSIRQQSSNIKQASKKGQRASQRSKSPLSEVQKSLKSSPEPSPAYSKVSGSDKHAFSKSKLSNKDNKFQSWKKQQNTVKNLSKISGAQDNHSLTNSKSKPRVIQKSDGKNNREYQLSFPQLITESQSAYPSSSYPNTGKQSQYYEKPIYSRPKSSQNSDITEEHDEILLQDDHLEQGHSDYISQGELEQFASRSEPLTEVNFPSQQGIVQSAAYQQLPRSYLVAMQILQAKVNEQQTTLRKLRKKLQSENRKYSQLQTHVSSLEQELEQKQEQIASKDAEIRFLKGYLDEERENNRQALKEVAKNVFERSISAKKQLRDQYGQDCSSVSRNKTNKKLFTESEKTQKNELKETDTKQKQKQPKTGSKTAFSKKSRSNQQKPLTPANQTKTESQQHSYYDTQNISMSNLLDKSREIQLLREKQLIQTFQRERQLKQQLIKQQLIKDEMMKKQILMEEKIYLDGEKKFNYLNQSRKSDRIMSSNHKLYTVKKADIQHALQKQGSDQGYRDLYIDGKRLRSISTAAKYSEQKNSNLAYPHRSIIRDAPSFGYGLVTEPRSIATSKQPLMDPVLQKYIQVKSQLSSSRYPQSAVKRYPYPSQNQACDLKYDKKNKQTVSKMRQLMRAEKDLVALNYKLEDIEKKILQCVKSTDKEERGDKTESKVVQDQFSQKVILEDLQKQYALMKKQFEKKQLSIKELKMKLDQIQ